MTHDKGIIDCTDEDKNTAFHTLCLNSVSCTEDLVYMYNILKKFQINRKAVNINNQTGLDILQARIKTDNPYDCSLPATKGFFVFITNSKRKSLLTIKSCPDKKRFSGISVTYAIPQVSKD